MHKDSKASGVGTAKDPGVVHKDSKASGVGTAKDPGSLVKQAVLVRLKSRWPSY